MIDWRGDCTDGSVPGDPEEDPTQYGAPPTPTYDPTDPNDPLYQGDPSQSTNGANIPSDYGQVDNGGMPGSGSSLLDKLLAALGGGSGGKGGPTGTTGNVGSVLGSAAKSAQTQNNFQDTLRAQIANQMEQSKLARQKFAVAAPSARLDSSTKASIESNYTPTKVNWGGPGSGLKGQVPTYSGGVSGAMANLDPKTKALAQQVMVDQLLGETQGGLSGGGQDSQMPNAPTVGQTSGLDKLLGGGGLVASLIAALTANNSTSSTATS